MSLIFYYILFLARFVLYLGSSGEGFGWRMTISNLIDKGTIMKSFAVIGKMAAAVAFALGTSMANAADFPDFTVDKAAVPGAGLVGTFQADKITGNYTEIITFGPGNTFAVSLLWNAGQFIANNGTTALQGAQTGLSAVYGIYALYQATGTFTPGATVTFTPNPGSGGLSVWLDPNGLNTFTAPGSGAGSFTVTDPGGNDVQLASGVVLAGDGSLNTACGGINCGSFGNTTTFNLTAPTGPAFFTVPSPFYAASFQSGQLNSFVVAGTQEINGSMDVIFTKVPEPASVALLGIGLLGLSFLRRRDRA